ncbi:MAG: hypothetical protein CMN32_03855 [Saprospirales bacterium]|nr:hypothetical protein [Saprospirales bacterium]
MIANELKAVVHFSNDLKVIGLAQRERCATVARPFRRVADRQAVLVERPSGRVFFSNDLKVIGLAQRERCATVPVG